MIERMENRDYVDKEHIIELEGHNAKIFFLKQKRLQCIETGRGTSD